MALINCPECSKEISDKAKNCPQCGFPVQPEKDENEEYLVCPKCLSKELHSEKAGFSGKKAVAGAVLTGGIGILAGTLGSKNIYITCLKCKNRFKAGEAKIVKSKGAINELEQKVINKYNETKSIIQTVKFYKDEKNVSLEESKKYVENLLMQNKIDWKASNNSGCMVVLIALVSIGIVISYFLI